MKGFVRAACLAVLVMPVLAVAQDYGCDKVNWGEEVLEGFSEREQGLPLGHDEEQPAVRKVRCRS